MNVVVIGGGTGTFTVLTGIKKFPYSISAIVSMMDSGGSTGKLRDQFGVLPPGDIRQCLVALSEAPEFWRKLFLYRFESGDFEGHNFGNIFLTALEKVTSTYQEVIDGAAYVLQTQGHVYPVTLDKVQLCAQYDDGEIIESEKRIDTAFHKKTRIEKVYLKPEAQPYEPALDAIASADFIVIGPGDLFTSLIPNLLVNGVTQSILKSKAKIVLIINLMTKRGQTPYYTAKDHVNDIEKYLGKKVDVIVINNEPIPKEVKKHYEKSGEQMVLDNLGDDIRIIRSDILAHINYEQASSDKTLRSLLRHDSEKLAKTLSLIMA